MAKTKDVKSGLREGIVKHAIAGEKKAEKARYLKSIYKKGQDPLVEKITQLEAAGMHSSAARLRSQLDAKELRIKKSGAKQLKIAKIDRELKEIEEQEAQAPPFACRVGLHKFQLNDEGKEVCRKCGTFKEPKEKEGWEVSGTT